jgi:hypothetical protein
LLSFFIFKLKLFFPQSAKNTEDLENDEELGNTKKFLCLTSESAGKAAGE